MDTRQEVDGRGHALPPSGFATLRDLVSFLLGGGILIYVIVFRDPPADVVGVAAGITLAGFPVAALFVNGGSGGRNADLPK